jgi:hypothetical protein
MRRNNVLSTSTSLFSMGTASVEIQIVSTSRGIVLDMQARNTATDGSVQSSHTVAKLALDEAVRLETLLGNAVSAAWDADDVVTERSDPRQTALWSPASFTAPATRRRAA